MLLQLWAHGCELEVNTPASHQAMTTSLTLSLSPALRPAGSLMASRLPSALCGSAKSNSAAARANSAGDTGVREATRRTLASGHMSLDVQGTAAWQHQVALGSETWRAARRFTFAVDSDAADRHLAGVERQLCHPILLHLHCVLQGKEGKRCTILASSWSEAARRLGKILLNRIAVADSAACCSLG